MFRYRPDGLLFNSPKANRDVYETKRNVNKGIFYDACPQKTGFNNTWNCTDKAKHARKRRILNAAFSDKAVKSSEHYIIQHADRWCELLLDGGAVGWSAPRDMAEWSDWLVFDILGESRPPRSLKIVLMLFGFVGTRLIPLCFTGELCYARSFNTKEPGDDELKSVPSLIAGYTRYITKVRSNEPLPVSGCRH